MVIVGKLLRNTEKYAVALPVVDCHSICGVEEGGGGGGKVKRDQLKSDMR